MAAEERSFDCTRCGRCCTGLLAEDKGVLRGLTLLPDERRLFPESKVMPTVVVGRRPHGRGFRVIAYQLTEDTCPHLKEDLCSVYQERPASCRQFPFSLGAGQDGSRLVGFDLSCPSLKNLFESGRVPHPSPDTMHYAEMLSSVEQEALKNPNRAWYFDLRTRRWRRYRELLGEEV